MAKSIEADHVVLAMGHCARDVFGMLDAQASPSEAKPFSIGFRIEHPQTLIDSDVWAGAETHTWCCRLRLVHHAENGRSVYSFCMCPGGTVVAAASEEGRVVTNGMSQYSRNERNANAGIVVGITPEDYAGDILAGRFQRRWENAASPQRRAPAGPRPAGGDFWRGGNDW